MCVTNKESNQAVGRFCCAKYRFIDHYLESAFSQHLLEAMGPNMSTVFILFDHRTENYTKLCVGPSKPPVRLHI